MSDVDTAVIALLEDNLANVHDGYVTDSDENEKTVSAPLPYVVYYGTPGYPNNGRLGGVPRGRVYEFQVTSVGSTRHQAAWAGDRAEEVLHGALIDVAGRSCRVRRTRENPFTGRDTTWTRPGGKPLFSDVRRYVVAR